jgi:hypothetical protein
VEKEDSDQNEQLIIFPSSANAEARNEFFFKNETVSIIHFVLEGESRCFAKGRQRSQDRKHYYQSELQDTKKGKSRSITTTKS